MWLVKQCVAVSVNATVSVANIYQATSFVLLTCRSQNMADTNIRNVIKITFTISVPAMFL